MPNLSTTEPIDSCMVQQ